MGGIKAIETKYAGRRFRSRLEARWAVFFTKLGASWDYEPEGYELPSGRYLPDFLVSEFNCWVEVKGQSPTPHELRLACELAEYTGRMVGVFYGGIVPANDGLLTAKAALCVGVHEGGENCLFESAEWAICDQCYRIRPTPFGDTTFMLCKDRGSPLSAREGRICRPNQRLSRPCFQPAYQAALSARFEFGEQG